MLNTSLFAFDPNCTKPCTGTTTVIGIIDAITTNNISPPPAPNAADTKDVKPASTISNSAIQGVTNSVANKSIFML